MAAKIIEFMVLEQRLKRHRINTGNMTPIDACRHATQQLRNHPTAKM